MNDRSLSHTSGYVKEKSLETSLDGFFQRFSWGPKSPWFHQKSDHFHPNKTSANDETLIYFLLIKWFYAQPKTKHNTVTSRNDQFERLCGNVLSKSVEQKWAVNPNLTQKLRSWCYEKSFQYIARQNLLHSDLVEWMLLDLSPENKHATLEHSPSSEYPSFDSCCTSVSIPVFHSGLFSVGAGVL